jgi:hypothetical protein
MSDETTIKIDKTYEVHVGFAIPAGLVPDQPVQYARHETSMFRPIVGGVYYTRQNGQGWKVDKVWLSGFNVKVDGTTGGLRKKSAWHGEGAELAGPKWLRDLVVENRPQDV